MKHDLNPCGHPVACVVSSDEGTNYCGWCEEVGKHAFSTRQFCGAHMGHSQDQCPVCRAEAAERERDEARGIIATSFDRLNTALREANSCEAIGDPYRSLALRDGIVNLYDRGASWRSRASASEARVAELHALKCNIGEALGGDDEGSFVDRIREMKSRVAELELALRGCIDIVRSVVQSPKCSIGGIYSHYMATVSVSRAIAALAAAERAIGEGGQ